MTKSGGNYVMLFYSILYSDKGYRLALHYKYIILIKIPEMA